MSRNTYIVSQKRRGGPFVLMMEDQRKNLPVYDAISQQGKAVTLLHQGKPVLEALLPQDGLQIDVQTRSHITFTESVNQPIQAT